jgi:hypothetical protein
MLTLRVVPPRLLATRRPRAPNDLAGLYFDTLRRHWSVGDSCVAAALAAGAALVNLRTATTKPHAWLNGWGVEEDALRLGSNDPVAHVSMATRKGLHRLLNPAAYPSADNPLKNKRLFALRCVEAGLPAPESFCGPLHGLRDWVLGHDAVVAKPNYSSKGKGVTGFRRASGLWSAEGRLVTQRELDRRLAVILRSGGVVQAACDTHPDLAEISPGALPTLRVMTVLNESGEPEACDRVIRLSGGGPRAVDNFNAGNIVASLDAEGRILRGFRRVGGQVQEVTRHPTAGRDIAGWRIPQFEDAVALALRAHTVFRDGFRVVGWDVGIAASGPCLIEGNWNPGSDILALVSGRGLGDTRLGALYRHHLERASPADWRACRPIQREPNAGRAPRAAAAGVCGLHIPRVG